MYRILNKGKVDGHVFVGNKWEIVKPGLYIDRLNKPKSMSAGVICTEIRNITKTKVSPPIFTSPVSGTNTTTGNEESKDKKSKEK